MFPSSAGLGGWAGRQAPQLDPVKLSTLNRDYRRFPDTYVVDYASFLRNPATGAPLAEPLAVLSSSERQAKVGIIGTGMSGLVAGLELARAGIDVTFYEAQNRVGGRARTEVFQDDTRYTGEMGAMRIPGDAKLVWHYYSLYRQDVDRKPDDQIDVLPFPNPGVVPTTINFGNLVTSFWSKRTDGVDEKPLPEPFATIRQDFIDAVILGFKVPAGGRDVDATVMNELMKKATLTPTEVQQIEGYWREAIRRFADVAFIDGVLELMRLAGKNWGEKQVREFAALGLGTGGFGPLFSVSFLDVLRIIVWDYAAEFQVEGGLSSFADKLLELTARALGKTVAQILKLGTPVLRLDYAPSQRKILVRQNGATDAFDYVIVGTTTRSMQHMFLDLNYPESPLLPALQLPDSSPIKALIGSVQSSIRVPNMVSASKTFRLLPGKPWADPAAWPQVPTRTQGNVPAKVTLNDKLPQQSYWLDPFPDDPAAKVPALLTYLWANESVKVQAVMDQVARVRLLASAYQGSSFQDPDYPNYGQLLYNAINMDDTTLRNTLQIDWQNTQFLFGGFKLDNPAEQYYTASLAFGPTVSWLGDGNTQPYQRLYLAGCTLSFYGGWVEGAMMSGINAATAVLLRIVGGSASAARVRSSAVVNPANVKFHQYQLIQESDLQAWRPAEARAAV